ncbi:MAG TPA: polysaccharide deacetylase family protein [Amycolatopsis sp.]|nr:polysaccharide deacetylase family protein [Amycolatopsis sp.]
MSETPVTTARPDTAYWASRLRRAALSAAGPLTTPVGSIISVRTKAPQVVVTFDDGPEPGSTERVLSALRDHRATATFFVLLTRAERSPRLLAEVVAAGHEVGFHGFDHRRLTRLPAARVRIELAVGAARLADLLGSPVRWFRPPHGAQTPRVWRAAREAGLWSVLWGPCAWDWLPRPVEELSALAMRGMRPGAILLAHDGLAGPDDGDEGDDCSSPPPRFDRGELVGRLLTGMAQRGLTGRSLSAVLAAGRPRLVPWFRR